MGIVTAITAGVKALMALIAGKGAVYSILFFGVKALIASVMFVALPLVIYNVFSVILIEIMEFTMSYVSESGVSDLTVELTGMGGWIANQIMLPQAFGVFMSFVSIRFVMRFLPFFR